MGSDARRVGLVGNPNTGKSSLFNALTGFHRHVANYPGVTVEIGRGPLRDVSGSIELLDLPGTYSLAALSPDEAVVSNAAYGRLDEDCRLDAIVAVIDASNLPRNLYLLSQVLELGLPTIVALNMVDIAAGRGLRVDATLLARKLGVPVLPVVAARGEGIGALASAIEKLSGAQEANCVEHPPVLGEEIARFQEQSDGKLGWVEAFRVLIDRDGYAEQQYLARGGSPEALAAARGRLADAGVDGPAAEVRARYAWISRVLEGVIERPTKPIQTGSSRIDRVVTHPVGGAVVLLAVLFVVFQAIFTWAGPLMDLIDGLFGWIGGRVSALLPAGMLQSLIVDGLIGGVGGVLVFLPQIMILFAFIAILEDCGYLSRAAYMVDRIMRAIGLSGRAFIPLLSSFACAVPAIMGTRVIADHRERFVTILIAPFMSCSARLPVYVLMIAAFVPATTWLGGWVSLQALVMLAMYLLGVVVAIPIAWVLKKTAFAGPSPTFMLELPSYKLPRLRAVWQRMYTAGMKFVVSAGTVILLVNLIVWALGYFPRSAATEQRVLAEAKAAGWDESRAESELAGAYLRDSYLGRMGHAIEPAIRPIGWDWRLGVAVIASFPAREVVIGTLGTIFNLGQDEDEESVSLRDALAGARWEASGAPLFTFPVALSLMVFFALCAQCSSTLVIIGRETGSWMWPVASFVTMTLIAYFAAWGTAAAARAVLP